MLLFLSEAGVKDNTLDYLIVKHLKSQFPLPRSLFAQLFQSLDQVNSKGRCLGKLTRLWFPVLRFSFMSSASSSIRANECVEFVKVAIDMVARVTLSDLHNVYGEKGYFHPAFWEYRRTFPIPTRSDNSLQANMQATHPFIPRQQ